MRITSDSAFGGETPNPSFETTAPDKPVSAAQLTRSASPQTYARTVRQLKSIANAVAFPLLLFAGCATGPIEVSVESVSAVEESTRGGGRTVSVNVVDERPRLQLGTSTGRSTFGTDVTVAGELTATVLRGIARGLRRINFVPVQATPKMQADLYVRILLFEYNSIDRGGLKMERRFEAALAGKCPQDGGTVYEQTYRGTASYEVFVNPAISPETTDFRDALSRSIDLLVKDARLQDCLARLAK